MPITFRCYQCNQVLRTGRSKAGAVVSCPKCGAELIVPEAPAPGPGGETGSGDHTPPRPGPAHPPRPEPSVLTEISVADIRVEPNMETHPAEPPAPAAPEPEPTAFGVVIEPEPIISPRTPLRPRRDREASQGPPPVPEPSPIASLEASLDNPAIDVDPLPVRPEPPSVIPGNTAPARPRDVVLPAAAVVSWSLFVIVALFLAFLAGLLAGHFVWTVKLIRT